MLPLTGIAKKDIIWDNWGHAEVMAQKGETVSIIKVIEPFNPERPWEYAIAEFKWLESSVSDFVSKDEVFIPELEN
jgi:hypothetical protein